MSLAPPWAKAAAVLGLRMQLDQLILSTGGEVTMERILEHAAEIARIEAMKN